MKYELLKNELQNFYFHLLKGENEVSPILNMLDEEAKKYPVNTTSYQFKAMMYDLIADKFNPVIFDSVPFYFEMGTKDAFGNGCAYRGVKSPGGWLIYKQIPYLFEIDGDDLNDFENQKNAKLYLTCGPFIDIEHYGIPFNNIFSKGLSGIYADCEKALLRCKTNEQKEFITTAMCGLKAVKKIAGKFAISAEERLKQKKGNKKYLELISKTARKCPWNKPETFYEGLNTLAFMREVIGSLEGIGTNTFGRSDKLLYGLYKNDLDKGLLTKEEAYDLICRFMLVWDCHDDKDNKMILYAEHEFENTLTLGGCDENGEEICNELTFMFLKAHKELKLIYPKIKCRISAKYSKAYFDAINEEILAGHSALSFINDDCMIPALVRSGKTLEDAREYIMSGCWDISVPDCEKRPGGEYVSMVKPLEMAIHHKDEEMKAINIYFKYLDGAKTFEEFYNTAMDNLLHLLETKFRILSKGITFAPQINPCPFYSSTVTGCLNNLKDYTAGGAKYNQGSFSLVGFANFVDSLLAIKRVCFDEKLYTLEQVLNAVRNNWKDSEDIRFEVLHSAFFGDESEESSIMAQRIHKELYDRTRKYKTSYGGTYDQSYYVYTDFRWWGAKALATPDGRFNGDYFAMGISPSRLHKIESATAVLNSVAQLDLTQCADNSVIDILLPAENMTSDILENFERTFAKEKLQCLQLNCINKEDLLDAQKHPEKHQDIVVRVVGFSAKFVSLSTEWQNEFLSRNFTK